MTMPDISGEWLYAGQALNSDGSILYEWSAQLAIEQDAEQVTLRLRTPKSDSRSSGALLRPLAGGEVALLYDYAHDEGPGALYDHDFFGIGKYRFAADGQSATGHYLNYNGRYTHGRMRLTRP